MDIRTRIKAYYAAHKTDTHVAALSVTAVLVVGSFITFSKAAGFFASTEAESGTKTANAVAVTDATASGGQAIKFTAPAVPSGWPDATNTGYKNAPGYTGTLSTSCPQNEDIQSNTTYSFCNYTSGLRIGNDTYHPTNVTFYGCRFASNSLDDGNVRLYGDVVTFDYSTFEPSNDTDAKPPTPYNQGYQYGIDQRYDGRLVVDHSDFWGWGNGIQIGYSSQAKPLTVKNSWFHDGRDDGGIDHTDGILENYGGNNYKYMTFDHNTIVSIGNTNGLALQNGNNGGYDHLTVTNNYFSGFGFTVNIGGSGSLSNSVFTGNTYGTDIKPTYGPLYGWNSSGTNNLWRNNKWHVPSGGWGNPAHDGWYWLPDGSDASNYGYDDSMFVSQTDYTGN
jgi:hypothetical protein